MSKIVVRKKITVTNDEYSASLVFASIAFKDYEKMTKELDELSVEDAKNNTSESFNFIRRVLAERFIEGEFKQGDEKILIDKDNLFDLPGDVLVDAFQQLLGKASPNS